VAGAVLFVVFVVEQRGDGKALVDAAISRSAAYRPPVAVAFLANWGFGALNILLTFWLQDVRGESAAMTGGIVRAYSVPCAALRAKWGFAAPNSLLAFCLQDVRGESAAMTGVIFLAYSVPFAVLGAVTGRVARRHGTALPMAFGMVLVAGSFLVLTQLGATAP